MLARDHVPVTGSPHGEMLEQDAERKKRQEGRP
jgi:hypothetical protein